MMNTLQRILIAEDEPMLANTLEAYLRKEGFAVCIAHDGAQVMPAFNDFAPQMVLLDIMLPSVDGMVLCEQIREVSQLPIIMLTARVDEVDRLLGLELGADDYICKPYSPKEVVARVKTIWKRFQYYEQFNLLHSTPATLVENERLAPAEALLTEPSKATLVMDAPLMEAYWCGVLVELTSVEFRLLWVFYREPRRVFSRQQLMDRIYDDDRIVSDRTIDSHITKLRKKLVDLGAPQEVIRSVYGAGYRLDVM